MEHAVSGLADRKRKFPAERSSIVDRAIHPFLFRPLKRALGLARRGETSIAPPEKTSATTGLVAAAVTAEISASCAAEKFVTVRSCASASSERSEPIAKTTRSAAVAAVTAAGMPAVLLDDTEGTPATAVAAGMNCVMAVSGATTKVQSGPGLPTTNTAPPVLPTNAQYEDVFAQGVLP